MHSPRAANNEPSSSTDIERPALSISTPAGGPSPAPCACAPCSAPRCQSAPLPLVIVVIIALNYIPYVLWTLERRRHLALTITLVVIFHALLGLVVCAWAYTCGTDPGVPPSQWQRRMAALAKARPGSSELKVCRRSGLYKPPRSHFCSVTRRLTLNMDHYCPWVANTVGHYNRKFFLLFLLYTCLLLAYVLLSIAPQLPDLFDWALDGDGRWVGGVAYAVVLGVMLAVDVLLLLLLGPFMCLHWKMAMRNQTTIDGDKLPQYDIGLSANLEQILGRRRLHWFCPCYCDGPVGDGVHWPTKTGGAALVPLGGSGTPLRTSAAASPRQASAGGCAPAAASSASTAPRS